MNLLRRILPRALFLIALAGGAFGRPRPGAGSSSHEGGASSFLADSLLGMKGYCSSLLTPFFPFSLTVSPP